MSNQSLFESIGSVSDKKKASQMDKDSDNSNQNVEDDFESCKDNSVIEQATTNQDQEQDQETRQTTPEKISFKLCFLQNL